jgi:hypothetical protein
LGLDLTDTASAGEWGVTDKAIETFRQELQKLGLLTVKGHKWITLDS